MFFSYYIWNEMNYLKRLRSVAIPKTLQLESHSDLFFQVLEKHCSTYKCEDCEGWCKTSLFVLTEADLFPRLRIWICCITAGTCVFTSVLAQCSARAGLGERGCLSCFIAVLVGFGTALAGMEIHRSVWTEEESPSLIWVEVLQGKFFPLLLLGKEEEISKAS